MVPVDSEYLFIDGDPENGQDILEEGLRLAGLSRATAVVVPVADYPAILEQMPNLKYVIPLGRPAWAALGLKGNMEAKAGIATVMEI